MLLSSCFKYQKLNNNVLISTKAHVNHRGANPPAYRILLPPNIMTGREHHTHFFLQLVDVLGIKIYGECSVVFMLQRRSKVVDKSCPSFDLIPTTETLPLPTGRGYKLPIALVFLLLKT